MLKDVPLAPDRMMVSVRRGLTRALPIIYASFKGYGIPTARLTICRAALTNPWQTQLVAIQITTEKTLSDNLKPLPY